jgi:hypothetical protein
MVFSEKNGWTPGSARYVTVPDNVVSVVVCNDPVNPPAEDWRASTQPPRAVNSTLTSALGCPAT